MASPATRRTRPPAVSMGTNEAHGRPRRPARVLCPGDGIVLRRPWRRARVGAVRCWMAVTAAHLSTAGADTTGLRGSLGTRDRRMSSLTSSFERDLRVVASPSSGMRDLGDAGSRGCWPTLAPGRLRNRRPRTPSAVGYHRRGSAGRLRRKRPCGRSPPCGAWPSRPSGSRGAGRPPRSWPRALRRRGCRRGRSSG